MISLREGRGRAQDQLGVADGFGNVSRHQRQLNIVSAVGVLEDNARAPAARCAATCRVAPPQADIVALKGRSPAAAREPLPPPSTAIFKTPLLAPAPARRAVAA
jgi:hypothetical protein